MKVGDKVLYRASSNDLVEAVITAVNGQVVNLKFAVHDQATVSRANVSAGTSVGQFQTVKNG